MSFRLSIFFFLVALLLVARADNVTDITQVDGVSTTTTCNNGCTQHFESSNNMQTCTCTCNGTNSPCITNGTALPMATSTAASTFSTGVGALIAAVAAANAAFYI